MKQHAKLPRDGRHLFISLICCQYVEHIADLDSMYRVRFFLQASAIVLFKDKTLARIRLFHDHILGFILFAAWGKKRDVVIVKPDNFSEKGDDNHNGADEDDDGESSGDSKQIRGSQRSEIAQVETKG